MSIQPNTPNQKPPILLAKVSPLLSWSINFILVSVILAIMINVLSNILTDILPTIPIIKLWIDQIKRGIQLVFQYPNISIPVAFLLLSLRYFASLGQNIEVPSSYKKLEQKYLSLMQEAVQTLVPECFPNDLNHVSVSARLEDIFILPQFYLNQPLVDQPIGQDILKKEHLEHESQLWLYPYNEDKKISLSKLWSGLTKDRPAAVIQGYPGMGKSTLVIGLTLYMVYCCLKPWKYHIDRSWERLPFSRFAPFLLRDHHMDSRLALLKSIHPPLIPVLVNLRDYATPEHINKSITVYLEQVFDKLKIPTSFLHKCLKNGRCLVLFDGLDEVSKDRGLYFQVHENINNFINECRSITKNIIQFNRFIITSRVVEHNKNAFPKPNYLHCVIAELTPKQCEDLLKGYCHAVVRQHPDYLLERQETVEVEIINRAEERARHLEAAIEKDRNIGNLAKNPLLLRLLVEVLIKQGRIELPRRKFELYKVATMIFLENYNKKAADESLSEEQVVQHLGFLATAMQEKDSSLLHHDDAVQLLMKSMDTKVAGEAEDFLKHFCRGSGLFVQCSDNHFGFFHRTFQEYFAARYLLSDVKSQPDNCVNQLVTRASHDRWREPFLLAVAYASSEDKAIANQILHGLLETMKSLEPQKREQALLLAANSLLEVKPLTVQNDLKRDIAEQLIHIYKEALQNANFELCNRIQSVMRSWLLSEEEDHLPILRTKLPEHASIELFALLIKQPIFDIFDTLIQQPTKIEQTESTANGGKPNSSPTSNDSSVEDKLQKFAQGISDSLSSIKNQKVREAMLAMIACFPLHTAGEITFTRLLAERTTEELVLTTCAKALKQAKPGTPEAIEAVKLATLSSITSISAVAKECLASQSQQGTP